MTLSNNELTPDRFMEKAKKEILFRMVITRPSERDMRNPLRGIGCTAHIVTIDCSGSRKPGHLSYAWFSFNADRFHPRLPDCHGVHLTQAGHSLRAVQGDCQTVIDEWRNVSSLWLGDARHIVVSRIGDDDQGLYPTNTPFTLLAYTAMLSHFEATIADHKQTLLLERFRAFYHAQLATCPGLFWV